jgi:methylated-DNA-[protein]-cysteine S-methyltransferase
MTLLASTVPTPFGPLTVIADRRARVVVRSGLVQLSDLDPPAGEPVLLDDDPFLDEVLAAVGAWVDGRDLQALARVPLRIPATEGFRSRAWKALHGVPAGATVTYAGLASLAGAPGAARASGTACARNPLAPFVPCHRVVPSSGGVGRYGYTPEVKTALLRHEGALPAA